jgi:APA family basic amino acid/polyamine antiporter
VNSVFILTTPMPEMAGKVEVALVAAPQLFGTAGTQIMAALICVSLVSTISAMMWIGPRVMMVMGEDLRGLRWLAGRRANGTPVRATLVQFALVNLLIVVSDFEQVLTGAQVLLQTCSFLTVLGVIILRRSNPSLPRPYKAWGYPATPLIFLLLSGWMLWHTIESKPVESAVGLAVAATGMILYFLTYRKCVTTPTYNHEQNTPTINSHHTFRLVGFDSFRRKSPAGKCLEQAILIHRCRHFQWRIRCGFHDKKIRYGR